MLASIKANHNTVNNITQVFHVTVKCKAVRTKNMKECFRRKMRATLTVWIMGNLRATQKLRDKRKMTKVKGKKGFDSSSTLVMLVTEVIISLLIFL